MNTQTAIRWFGFVLLLGGVLGVICILITPTGDAASVIREPLWVPVKTLSVLGNMLLGFGLFGLYLAQADKIGKLGLVAFALAFFAANAMIATSAISAYVYPALVKLDPSAPSIPDLLPLVNFLNLEFMLCYEPGMILLSILTLRSDDFSRGAAWLLIIGSVGSNAILFEQAGPPIATVALYLAKLFMMIWSLALAWLGYQVWSGEAARQVVLRAAEAKA